MLYNPYRNYDKGMEDAYCGRQPEMPYSNQYMEGYERELELEREEELQRQIYNQQNLKNGKQ